MTPYNTPHPLLLLPFSSKIKKCGNFLKIPHITALTLILYKVGELLTVRNSTL
jgi:hypothetical protein